MDNPAPIQTPSTSKLPTILLVVSALGLFATTALLAYQNVSLQQQISSLELKIASKPKPTPTPTLAVTPTPTKESNAFCGGIAAIPCPSGFSCKLDGTYPDAGGKCETNTGEGTLKGTVIKSPTCAGPQRVGQICEAPYPNGEFILYREEGRGNVHLVEIKSVKTDSLGKFTTNLEPGNYKLKNLKSGIGNDVTNNDINIVAGKTTTITFNIDTGIR